LNRSTAAGTKKTARYIGNDTFAAFVNVFTHAVMLGRPRLRSALGMRGGITSESAGLRASHAFGPVFLT
jgi:hypothetical protein